MKTVRIQTNSPSISLYELEKVAKDFTLGKPFTTEVKDGKQSIRTDLTPAINNSVILLDPGMAVEQNGYRFEIVS